MSDMLSIGSSGILAYQYALTTTSNNIANAAVEGYSRQETALFSAMPRAVGVEYIGSGIFTDGARRQYDAFVEANLQRSISELRGQEPLVSYANRAFDLLSSPQVGLTPAFDAFFASVRALAAEPGSLIARGGFLREADGLAAGFRQLSGQWALLEEESSVAATKATQEINSLSIQLATMNKQLARRSTAETQPPELLDQRDNLLRRLSGLAGIRTAFEANGEVKVSLNASLNADEGGAIIVDADRSTTLQVNFDPQGRAIVLMNPFSVEARAVNGLSGGRLGGVIAFREQVLLPGRARLDDLAMAVAREVNVIHREGIDARGRPGEDLFGFDATVGATASLEVLITDPKSVAAAGPLRVVPAGSNVTGTEATVSFVPPRPTQPIPLTALFDPAEGQPTRTASVELDAYEGITSISEGLTDVAIQFDVVAGQWPQLLTRDGRHLLGGPLTEVQRTQLMGYGGFNPGAMYSDAYLNADSAAEAYLGASYFIGARALPASSLVYDVNGTDPHQVLSYQSVPASLQGQPIVGDSPIVIDDGALVLNGQALTGYAGPGTVEDLAAWLNAQSELTGVIASIVYPQSADSGSVSEAPTLLLTATDAGSTLQLGVGSSGYPADLAKLGFRTTLYWDGEVPEDLIVMATSTVEGPTDLQVSATYAQQEYDPLQALRSRRFQVDFDSETHYRITDVATGSVLAERTYDPLAATIEYRGLVVSLDSAPSAGDRYRIDGNLDGIGDNSNLRPLAALENRKLQDGYSMSEVYTALAGRIGTVAWQAGLAQEALAVVNTQALQARDAASGVSLDTEAANLIRFQQAYQANAKVMQVATDLFDTLVGIG